ncbi:MAG: cobyrinate a,c-diamide synthase [Alphaproteobacteria bacterium]
MTVPALIIAAPSSGSGKTIVTLGLLRHLRAAGVRLGSFKVGPDYIDPAFHAAASGRVCVNLDPWAMRPAIIESLIADAANGADLVIGEGVMGLFDGAADGTGSTADLAARLGIPVVLVIDVRGQGASAAAVAQGFAKFRDDVDIAGIILNRTGSDTHARMIEDACRVIGVPVLGAIRRDEGLVLPDRHLGLVQAGERPNLDRFLDGAAATIGRAVDTEALRAAARPFSMSAAADASPLPPLGQRIAVARDIAFAFAYSHMLSGWAAQGAEILTFSPLADEAPADHADAVFLPGGYPELHAGRLAANANFLGGLHAAAARNVAIHGECGGYMVLGAGLTDADGTRHAMAGLLPLETSFASRRLTLGYRAVLLNEIGVLGLAGAAFRGHEFHYATIITEDRDRPLFATRDARGRDIGPVGSIRGSVQGSFVHLIDAAE